MRVDNDNLVDARRTRTQKEPKQQSNKCSQKSKEKGKTRKKRTFSQETLSSKKISKELKSKQQIPNYETPLLKRPWVICWGPEAYVGVRDKTPVNWGLKGCGANKNNKDGTFVVDISAVEE
jgi:hypothetical protein